MTTITKTADFLKSHDNYILLTHKRPDGDTLGSASALCNALRRIGKTAFLLPNLGITERFVPFVSEFIAPSGTDIKNSVVVSVDVAALDMLPPENPENISLAIDHHPSNPGIGELTLLDASRAACGQIILEVIEALCGNVTKKEADLLYIALSTDTGCFQHGNTDADAFLAASKLAHYGADVASLNVTFFKTLSKARLTLEGLIYSSLISAKDNRINIAIVTKEMIATSGATENDMDDLASLAGKVDGNIVSATIKETDFGSKVSMRSNGAIDVSEICSRFGGGGHVMASGCEMACSPKEAADTLLRIFEELVI